jgi:hypothetical protein
VTECDFSHSCRSIHLNSLSKFSCVSPLSSFVVPYKMILFSFSFPSLYFSFRSLTSLDVLFIYSLSLFHFALLSLARYHLLLPMSATSFAPNGSMMIAGRFHLSGGEVLPERKEGSSYLSNYATYRCYSKASTADGDFLVKGRLRYWVRTPYTTLNDNRLVFCYGKFSLAARSKELMIECSEDQVVPYSADLDEDSAEPKLKSPWIFCAGTVSKSSPRNSDNISGLAEFELKSRDWLFGANQVSLLRYVL